MPHESIYMIEKADRSGYRQTTSSDVLRLELARTIIFEGVDGDEEANTVTYWHRRRKPSDDE